MRPQIDEAMLTAYALGELDARERGRVAAHVDADADARRFVEEVRETAGLVTDQLALEGAGGLTPQQHDAIERRLREHEREHAETPAPLRLAPRRATRTREWLPFAASLAASIAIVCGSLAVLAPWMYPNPATTGRDVDDGSGSYVIRPGGPDAGTPNLPGRSPEDPLAIRDVGEPGSMTGDDSNASDRDWEPIQGMRDPREFMEPDAVAGQDPSAPQPPDALPASPATPTAPAPNPTPPQRVASKGRLGPASAGDAEDLGSGTAREGDGRPAPRGNPAYEPRDTISVSPTDPAVSPEVVKNGAGAVEAPKVYENPFRLTSQRPRSSFPVRVETDSYKVVRRRLLERQLPPPHAVRIEELVNRFRYAYAPPADPEAVLAATVEVAACPWNVRHRLARVAIKAREGGATVVARDVEVAVEFNPVVTAQWRLIGYENAPASRDGQPAGHPADLAAGGTATAFYEIVPAAAASARNEPSAATPAEPFTVTVRYRDPADGTAHNVAVAAVDAGHGFDRASPDFRFASAVAAFGMLLRDSQFKGRATYGDVIRWAADGRGADETSERAAFLDLARSARDAANQRAKDRR